MKLQNDYYFYLFIGIVNNVGSCILKTQIPLTCLSRPASFFNKCELRHFNVNIIYQTNFHDPRFC